MTTPRSGRLLLLLAALGACSPYPYEGPSTKFSEAFTKLRGTYASAGDRLRATTNLVSRTAWTLDRPELALVGCSNRKGERGHCRVVPAAQVNLTQYAGITTSPEAAKSPGRKPAKAKAGEDACAVVDSPRFVRDGKPGSDAVNPEAARELAVDEVFETFSDYTAGLSAITKAADRAAFDAAAEKASSALGSLVGAAGTAAGQPAALAAAPVVKAATSGVLWLVGTGLDYRRYETLKASVIAACRPVRILAKTLPFILEVPIGAQEQVDKQLVERRLSLLNARRGPKVTSDQVYGQMADDLLAAVDIFNARGVDPDRLAGDIIQAHDELVLAVWRNTGQLAAAEKAMTQLNEHVAAIRKAAVGAAAATKDGA